ncbi:hypothetical protein EI94DRAFT_1731891 [Lactarius quietus]|nr:hypothetical protein EI94DRAFT_1731891 [Lactarius quietus]
MLSCIDVEQVTEVVVAVRVERAATTPSLFQEWVITNPGWVRVVITSTWVGIQWLPGKRVQFHRPRPKVKWETYNAYTREYGGITGNVRETTNTEGDGKGRGSSGGGEEKDSNNGRVHCVTIKVYGFARIEEDGFAWRRQRRREYTKVRRRLGFTAHRNYSTYIPLTVAEVTSHLYYIL